MLPDASPADDALPTDAALLALFDALRADGYRLGLHQFQAAQAIVQRLRAQAGTGDAEAARLVTLLTPILATSPAEQADLHHRLACWLGLERPGMVGAASASLPEAGLSGWRRLWRALVSGGMAPGATALAVRRVLGSSLRCCASAMATAWIAAFRDVRGYDPARRRRGLAVAGGALGALAGVLILAYCLRSPDPVTPPGTVVVDGPDVIDPSVTEPEIRRETITTVFFRPGPFYGVARWGLVGLPLATFLGWLGLMWWWRRPWQARRLLYGDMDDILDHGHRTAGVALFAAPELAATANQWRRFRREPTRELEPERTVAATVDNAGLFTPVWRDRPLSTGYVVLIEAHGRHDHLARLADVAVDRLAAEGVAVERYYYTDGIGHLRPAGGGPTRRLADLAVESPHRTLVIVGSGADLFAPLSAALDPPTAAALDLWPQRALLSQRPIATWADRELALLDHGMALATASRRGLRALGDAIAAGPSGRALLLEGVLVDRGGGPVNPDRTRPPGTVFRDLEEPWCPEMVVIPAGRFLMGSPDDEPGRFADEGPQHEVVIAYRFALGRTPVTFAEYDHYCDVTGMEKPNDESWGRDQRPVISVSWDDAQGYVRWLAQMTGQPYRLPSEAEWEYACRAGSTGRWCFGDDERQLEHYAWYGDNSHGRTQPVGQMRANGFGLHDGHGNVWEWVADGWHDDYRGAPADGSVWGFADNSVGGLRGGSWISVPRYARAAVRISDSLGVRNYNIGFRLARTLNPGP